MDANHEMMFWCLAYRDSLAIKARREQTVEDTTDHRLLMRRRLARWCGHVALRVGVWLLTEEVRTGGEQAKGPHHQTVVPRS